MRATIAVGIGSLGIVISPDGSHAYVANAGSNSVSVIDAATNTVTTTGSVGPNAQSLAITPDGTHASVACFGSNAVFVINTATNAVTATVCVGANPVQVAITPPPVNPRSFAYVTNSSSSSVSVIEQSDQRRDRHHQGRRQAHWSRVHAEWISRLGGQFRIQLGLGDQHGDQQCDCHRQGWVLSAGIGHNSGWIPCLGRIAIQPR